MNDHAILAPDEAQEARQYFRRYVSYMVILKDELDKAGLADAAVAILCAYAENVLGKSADGTMQAMQKMAALAEAQVEMLRKEIGDDES